MHQLTYVIQQALVLVLVVSGPPIILALVIGFAISVFQAATQIQEQTLSFAPKLVIIFGVLGLAGSWMGATLLRFSPRFDPLAIASAGDLNRDGFGDLVLGNNNQGRITLFYGARTSTGFRFVDGPAPGGRGPGTTAATVHARGGVRSATTADATNPPATGRSGAEEPA